MTGDARARTRWSLGAGIVLVVLVSTLVWSSSRPPLHGDVAWRASAEELGLDPGARPNVSEVSGDYVALEAGETAAVVDADGRPVHTGLPASAWQLRDDGSGWGLRFEADADAAFGSVEIAAWDADGEVTDVFRSTDDTARVLQEADVDVVGRSPRPAIMAHTEDVVVLGECHEAGPDDSYSYVIGLDTRAGEVVWSEQASGRCYSNSTSPWDAGVFLAPAASDGPYRYLETASGREVWREPEDAESVSVAPGAQILWWTDGVLHRRDPESGGVSWSRELCDGGDRDVLAPSNVGTDMLYARCGAQRWAIEPMTGDARELPSETQLQGYTSLGADDTDAIPPALGSVLAELDGDEVHVSDPVGGDLLWTHSLDEQEGTPTLLASYTGPHPTVTLTAVRRDDGDDQPATEDDDKVSRTSVRVLDGRTGVELAWADTGPDEGAWRVTASDDGSALVSLSGDDDSTYFWVPGRA